MNCNPATDLVIEGYPVMRAALCAAIADESDLTIAAVTRGTVKVLDIAETLLHQAHPTIPILRSRHRAPNC